MSVYRESSWDYLAVTLMILKDQDEELGAKGGPVRVSDSCGLTDLYSAGEQTMTIPTTVI